MIDKINLKDAARSTGALFTYLRIGTLNNHMLHVLRAENRMLEFHIHEHSDELFYCIEGEFDIEFADGMTHLQEGDLIIIPQGTLHRPICKGPVKCLLMETEGALDENNTGGTYGRKG